MHDRPSCAEIMKTGSWKRMPGDELRWQCEDREISLEALIPDEATIHNFNSITGGDKIYVIICSDGGLISYHRDNGRWIHTLNSMTPFKLRLVELNLMPIQDLHGFFHGDDNESLSQDSTIHSGE